MNQAEFSHLVMFNRQPKTKPDELRFFLPSSPKNRVWGERGQNTGP